MAWGGPELVHAMAGLTLDHQPGATAQDKALAIAGKHEGHRQPGGIVQHLPHDLASRCLRALGLDQRQRNVPPVEDEARLLGALPRATSRPRTVMRPLVNDT